MEWSSIYKTGIEKMDQEHKFLFDLIEQFKRSIKAGQGKEKINSTLANLVKYVRVHFKNEETYLLKINYPDIESHKTIHRGFISELLSIIERYKSDKSVKETELYIFLLKWLQQHIAVEDQKYAKYRS